jgi:hypothetical protein
MLLLATFQKWVKTPLLPSNNSLEPITKTTLAKEQSKVDHYQLREVPNFHFNGHGTQKPLDHEHSRFP